MGRHVYGIAALFLGLACLALHDQLISNWAWTGAAVFLYVTSLAQMAGGMLVQFRPVERTGALVLGATYLLVSLTWLPPLVAQPGVYANWGDVFYPLALVAGAMAAYGMASPAAMLLGLCSLSFAIEQVEFLGRTIGLVPKWMPLGGTFWAVGTAIAFVLAGISLLSGYRSRLAARLLAAMLVIFAAAVYVPALIAVPGDHGNWSEGLETFAIAGAAWIVADFMAAGRKATL